LLSSALWKLGLRFRKNVGTLPGKPDVVFARQRVIVFCDGDFWHGKNWVSRRMKLRYGHNAKYWVAKIKTNIARDRKNNRILRKKGWTVLRLWESDILKNTDKVAQSIKKIVRKKTLEDR
jgi:DNA mismatch endonuclease (patch repair protein)